MLAARPSLLALSLTTIVSTAGAQIGGPVQSARFVHEDGSVVEVDGISTVDVTRPSVLVLRVEFQSDLYAPETDTWSVDEFDFRWRFFAGEVLLPFGLGAGAWVGASLAKPDAILLEFDRDTGAGIVRLSLPLGSQVRGTELRFSLLPEATTHVEVVLGWSGNLVDDELGQLLGALTSFDVEVLPTCPDVWIDPVSRALPVVALHQIAVFSREAIETERTYMLHNPWPDMVRFDADLSGTGDLEVVFAPGESIAMVPIRAIAPGPFSLELKRVGGEYLASSGLVEGTYAFGATLERVVDSTGKVLPGAFTGASVPDDEIYDANEGPIHGGLPLHRRCYPASAPSGDIYVECSKCEEGTQTDATCAENVQPFTAARCPKTLLWYSCFPINQVVTKCTYENPEAVPSACTVGGFWVSVGFSIGPFQITGGHTPPSGIQICCTYKKKPGSCTTTGVKGCTG